MAYQTNNSTAPTAHTSDGKSAKTNGLSDNPAMTFVKTLNTGTTSAIMGEKKPSGGDRLDGK